MYFVAVLVSILIGVTCGIVAGNESGDKWIAALMAGTVVFCLITLFVFLGV